MRVLTPVLGTLLLASVAPFATAVSVHSDTTSLTRVADSAAVSVPPNETDHGVDNRTFPKLWAGDVDGNVSENTTDSAMATLANGTDIPLDTPPRAVERWNRGELGEFPATNRTTSIHPPDAELTDGRFIKDAYASIFAVQPSTRARISNTNQPLYVRQDGTVLGTVDYRVQTPPSASVGDVTVHWRLNSHSISRVRLLANGSVVASQSGSHTPTFEYHDLDIQTGEHKRLTLEATIHASADRIVEICTKHDENGSGCARFNTTVHPVSTTVTVRDSVTVAGYHMTVSGYRARYPNGDLGLVVYRSVPWQGFSIPNGTVNGVWRFYSARNKSWDRLAVSTGYGQRSMPSPLVPLQVSAYPIQTGPSTEQPSTSIVTTYGQPISPPSLPTNVHLDTLNQTYTASFGIATRVNTSRRFQTLTARGLVRGVNVTVDRSAFAHEAINRSNLTLAIESNNETAVTLRARLTDATTGAPIDTHSREGYLLVAGHRVNTGPNGTVELTVSRGDGSFAARYVPGHWWRNQPGYTRDSDAVYARGTILEWIHTLYRLAVPVSLFLLAVYLIDRITGWQVWPLWRWV